MCTCIRMHHSIPVLLQWAYGVTCWEMYTGGKVPYAGVFPRELSRQLQEGFRLKKKHQMQLARMNCEY